MSGPYYEGCVVQQTRSYYGTRVVGELALQSTAGQPNYTFYISSDAWNAAKEHYRALPPVPMVGRRFYFQVNEGWANNLAPVHLSQASPQTNANGSPVTDFIYGSVVNNADSSRVLVAVRREIAFLHSGYYYWYYFGSTTEYFPIGAEVALITYPNYGRSELTTHPVPVWSILPKNLAVSLSQISSGQSGSTIPRPNTPALPSNTTPSRIPTPTAGPSTAVNRVLTLGAPPVVTYPNYGHSAAWRPLGSISATNSAGPNTTLYPLPSNTPRSVIPPPTPGPSTSNRRSATETSSTGLQGGYRTFLNGIVTSSVKRGSRYINSVTCRNSGQEHHYKATYWFVEDDQCFDHNALVTVTIHADCRRSENKKEPKRAISIKPRRR